MRADSNWEHSECLFIGGSCKKQTNSKKRLKPVLDTSSPPQRRNKAKRETKLKTKNEKIFILSIKIRYCCRQRPIYTSFKVNKILTTLPNKDETGTFQLTSSTYIYIYRCIHCLSLAMLHVYLALVHNRYNHPLVSNHDRRRHHS